MMLGVLQARVSSTRLPGKVLKPILGQPMLLRQIERIQHSKKLHKIIVATSTEPQDDSIEFMCRQNNIECFRGSLNDVLDRFYQAAKKYMPEHVVRLTGDCPLADPDIIDQLIDHHLKDQNDYTSNTIIPTFPDGLDVEIVKFSCLEEAWQKSFLPSHREHVTPFFYTQPSLYKLGKVQNSVSFAHLRWTVDEQADFDLVTKIYESLYQQNPRFNFKDILDHVIKFPELQTLNIASERNEGMQKSILEDKKFIANSEQKNKYKKSQMLLEKALRLIPLGSQTFSKSITQYPQGVSPHFIERGQGCHVWDVDGNEYIDFVNGLASINIGYNDPDVNQAVLKQLASGVSFSLAHPIELRVAEQIVEMVPCAEMVRFGKNGSDATAGAIRLARAYTNKDHVAVCGYHGWQDWYIGSTTRNLGVPKTTQELTHRFNYNDLASLEKIFIDFPRQIAAVIIEPMYTVFPKENFLQQVKEMAHQHGAILIFDEVITGFRLSKGGAQELFNVTPDLAALGKGMGNGYPLSAIVGKREIMSLMEDIFFSFTFGGEAVSLAAASATLHKIQTDQVLENMVQRGNEILDGVKKLLDAHQLHSTIEINGHPSLTLLTFKDTGKYSLWEIKTFFIQEMFMRNIFTYGCHNMSYAHSKEDVQRLLNAYDDVFMQLKISIVNNTLLEKINCNMLKPLFSVR